MRLDFQGNHRDRCCKFAVALFCFHGARVGGSRRRDHRRHWRAACTARSTDTDSPAGCSPRRSKPPRRLASPGRRCCVVDDLANRAGPRGRTGRLHRRRQEAVIDMLRPQAPLAEVLVGQVLPSARFTRISFGPPSGKRLPAAAPRSDRSRARVGEFVPTAVAGQRLRDWPPPASTSTTFTPGTPSWASGWLLLLVSA